MTADHKPHDTTIPDAQPSLPFSPGDFSHVRVNRSGLAKMLGVSKQAVSTWVKRGLITVGVDGLINPREAVQQLMRNADPSRLRARVLRPLVQDVGTLQRRVTQLEAELAAARVEIEELQYLADLDEAQWFRFRVLLLDARDEVRAAAGDEQAYIELMQRLATRSEELARIAIEEVDEDEVDLDIGDIDLSNEALVDGLADLNRMGEELQAENRRNGIAPHALSRKNRGEGRE